MRVELIRRASWTTTELRSELVERLRDVLHRFGHRIRRVAVFLADLNGPKGGVDKSCRLVVHLERGGSVVAEGREGDTTGAVERAAQRARGVLVRLLDRRRESRRRSSGIGFRLAT